MNAKDFGAFLARTRKACGLTQADLAAQLHVTDKAVSRWERGVGLPDINTLEPLADALGLTLSDLMHCRDPQETSLPDAEPTLEDFLTMLRRPHHIDWYSIRAALLCLSILLAVWGVCFHPGVLVVHWHGLGNGDFRADGWMQSLLIFPLLLALECFTLNLWRLFEQTGYFRHWGEWDAALTNSLDFLSPGVRLVKFALDYFFFFCCGLTVPFCEFLLIVMN